MIGNAVPVKLSEALAIKIKKIIFWKMKKLLEIVVIADKLIKFAELRYFSKHTSVLKIIFLAIFNG